MATCSRASWKPSAFGSVKAGLASTTTSVRTAPDRIRSIRPVIVEIEASAPLLGALPNRTRSPIAPST